MSSPHDDGDAGDSVVRPGAPNYRRKSVAIAGVVAAAAAFMLVVGLIVARGSETTTTPPGTTPNNDVCSNSDSPLVRAAGYGELAEVNRLLTTGANPNSVDRSANTALGCAIPRWRNDVVAALLAHGADPNGDTGDGPYMEIPLALAIRRHNAPAVDQLLAVGADVNRSDCLGGPLAMAARVADPDLVRRLLNVGAQPNGQPEDKPPLFEAARADSIDAAAALLQAGANADGTAGSRPLVRAAEHGDLALLDLLVAHGAVLDTPSGGTSPGRVLDDGLDLAASNGHVDMVNKLLVSGANPNHDAHLSPLLRAIFYQREDVVVVLLEHGADPNLGNVDELSLAAITSGLTPSTGSNSTGTTAPTPSPNVSKALSTLVSRGKRDLFNSMQAATALPPGTTSPPTTAESRLSQCSGAEPRS